MNKSLLFLTSLGLVLCGGAAVMAGPPPDVPPGHWAASAVRRVSQKKIMAGEPDGKFHGEKPVTRYELAVALDRMVRYIEAGRKPLHATPPQAGAPVPVGADPSVKAAVAHLSRNGFLPLSSPILKGRGTELVTARQLSDALAQVTIRLSDRSIPPNKE